MDTFNGASEQAILNTRWNAAAMEFGAAEERCRPSVVRPVKVIRDGDQWSCSLYWPEERSIVEQLVTFGDTPEDACKAFDKAWKEKKAK